MNRNDHYHSNTAHGFPRGLVAAIVAVGILSLAGCGGSTEPQPGPDCRNHADCNDGRYCNGAELCVNGTCVEGTDPCPDVCSEAMGACVMADEPECPDCCTADAECDDGDPCTVDRCAGQACRNEPLACSDGMYCSNGECVECDTDDQCMDGLFCNGAEMCLGGVCIPGNDPCGELTCVESADACVEPQPEPPPCPECCETDSECDDGLFCTGQELCQETCTPGTPPCGAAQICDEGRDICIDPLAVGVAGEMDAMAVPGIEQTFDLQSDVVGGVPPYEYAWIFNGALLASTEQLVYDFPNGLFDIDLQVTDADRTITATRFRLTVSAAPDLTGRPPHPPLCAAAAFACTTSAVLVDVFSRPIDGSPAGVVVYGHTIESNGPVPNEVLVSRVGETAPETVQLSAPIDVTCECTEDGPVGCTNTCFSANDGVCDDGRSGAPNAHCAFGTDCADCEEPGTFDCVCPVWRHNDTVFAVGEADPSITLAPGSHYVELTTVQYEFTKTTEVLIHVNPERDELLVGPTALNYCIPSCGPGDQLMLFANIAGGTPPYDIAWAPEEDFDDPTAAAPTLTVTDTRIYTVTVSDAEGRHESATIDIGNIE